MNKILTFLTFLFLCIGIKTQASVIYVYGSATGAQNGTNWLNAFIDLQSALNAANLGDEIWVAKGTYIPTQTISGSTDNRDKAFVMKQGVPIYGGFNGTETSLNQRHTDSISLHVTNKTILSGDIGVPNDTSDNAYHVIIVSKLSNFKMEGFTIKHGNATDSSSVLLNGRKIFRDKGAGIYNDSTKATYKHIIIEDNLVWSVEDYLGGGAGMFNYKSNVIIENARFQNNHAHNTNGGAMANESSAPEVSNTVFYNNYATGGDEGGGAINNSASSNGSFTNVIFENNMATNSGGAVYNDGSSPTFTNVIFLNNSAGDCGGGVDNDGTSNAVFNSVKFINNYAASDGGGIYCWKSSVTLDRVEFDGNEAGNNGGGMYNYNTCDPKITNTKFLNNIADNDYGGFGLERASTATITNVLFARNHAGRNGGGFGAHDNHSTNATLILTNVTAVNNHAPTGGGAYDRGTTSQIRNSIMVGNYPEDLDINLTLIGLARKIIAVGDIIPAPVFIDDGSVNPLGTAITWPIFVDTLNSDYRLHNSSFARDIGDNDFFASTATPDLSAITEDLNFSDRIMNNTIDLGPYEVCADTMVVSANFEIDPSSGIVNLGSTATLTISTQNSGGISVDWYKNDTLIPGVHDSVLTVTAGVDFNDGDTYKAKVNILGQCTDVNQISLAGIQVWVNTTGINSVTKKELFKLYPNPNNGNFKLAGDFNTSKLYNITLANTFGQTVFQSEPVTAGPNQLDIQINKNLAEGVYFMILKEDGQILNTQRFIINK
ncbi:MAG TPA: T9SS type A sorting domain-containing protein [Edaphocola sp.]|nr:T9SS type A sorting domain-containing protein [Edaphocola sp.]